MKPHPVHRHLLAASVIAAVLVAMVPLAVAQKSRVVVYSSAGAEIGD